MDDVAERASQPLPDCRSCGACCSFSRDWPRFTLESDDDIARIPAKFVDGNGAGMRCSGDRCSALAGEVGISTSCRIYELRPDVCRDCQPGDDACLIARAHFRLGADPAGEPADAAIGPEHYPARPR